MTFDQKPVGSPFSAKSTAMEVIEGVDLSGKFAIVTGGYSGIGVETVRALVSAGAEVLVPVRDAAKAKETLEEFGSAVSVAELDLSDLSSVAKFTGEVAAAGKPIHLLINNAGVMACPETRVGPGWELQFATNHIGHFAMTKALTPLLAAAKGARVVALSSTGHKITPIRWDDIHFNKDAYNKWTAYGQSKTANALFAVELDRRMKDEGVRAFSVHPGGINTPLQRHLTHEEMVGMGWIDENGEPTELALKMFKTVEEGASTTVWAATSSMLDGIGGVYCENCEVAKLGGDDSPRWAEVQPYAVDPGEAERLWAETEKMIAG